MTELIKKVVFLLVLAGLLTWGVATMAQGPSITGLTNGNATMLHGQTIENTAELSRDTIRPAGRL